MQKFLSLGALALALLAPATVPNRAAAAEAVETYVARLGPDDHFNTKGERLTTAAAIIRQDRANYHEFRIRDADDDSDTVFRSKANRARMERMLARGGGSKRAIREIVDGNPLVQVTVYDEKVEVEIVR